MIRQVLVVDDDKPVRDALSQTLELADYDVVTAGSFIEAKDHIAADFKGVILSDIRMPGRDGFHLLEHTRGLDAELPVILLTGEGDIPMAVKAMGQGAFDFLEKPCAPRALMSVLERALKTRELVLENRRLKAQLETGDPAARLLFGNSSQAEALRNHARLAARSDMPVLVTGPAGSGISKVAEVIHMSSPRATGPFQKRAAQGLDRAGLDAAVRACRGGSLYLEEIGTLPMDGQLALMDLLEGDENPRIITGSTAELQPLVADGQFHSDLFYRFEAMLLRIPSLSERPEDIPVLFRHYVAQASGQTGLTPPEITPEIITALMSRDWPGNAQSLMSAAMRFVLGMPDETIRHQELGLSEQMARIERSLLVAALGKQNGRAAAAAETLKLPRKTFYDKLARYGIRPEDYRR